MEKKSENQSIHEKADQLVRYYKVNSILKKEDALNIVFSKIEKGEKSALKSKSPSLWITITSVAASIAIAVTIYVFAATADYSCVAGDTATVRLPDNSRVVLQGESVIKHKRYFWKRKVQLQGEAYFEVQKGSRFVVSAKQGSVEVLGTRFLVSENRESMFVKCFEGKVNTRLAGESFILTAGMQVSGNRENGTVQKFVHEEYPEFAVFSKSYSNTEIDKITKDIEHFFGVVIDPGNNGKRTFSGAFETGTLEGAMAILMQSLQLNYKVEGKNRLMIYKN